MARLFDPIKQRSNFDRFLLKMDLSQSASAAPIQAGAAILRLVNVVNAWLVGLQTQTEPVLRDCHAILKWSIQTGESLGDLYIPPMRSQAFGLAHWMLNNQNDAAVYRDAVDQFDFHFKQGGQEVTDPDFFNKETQRFEPKIQRGLPLSAEEITRGYLVDYLACCIQSEQYERGVSLCERIGAAKVIDPSRIKKVTEFGYWACRESLRGNIPIDTYLSVGECALKGHLQSEWLAQGHMLIAANWLKILYWQSGVTAAPLDTILKAYDLMPDVPRPTFV